MEGGSEFGADRLASNKYYSYICSNNVVIHAKYEVNRPGSVDLHLRRACMFLAWLAVRKKHLWSSLPAAHAGQTASGLSSLIPQWGFPARKMLTTISHGSNTPLRASQRDGTVPSIVLDGGLGWVAHNRYSTSKRGQRALSLTL